MATCILNLRLAVLSAMESLALEAETPQSIIQILRLSRAYLNLTNTAMEQELFSITEHTPVCHINYRDHV